MKWVVGIDEVGRGPLAGPVYVCAVAIPENVYKTLRWGILNDSKQMTAANREIWSAKAYELEEKGKAKIAIASRTAAQIDRKGIAVCIRECIAENLEKTGLSPKDCRVLLDGSLKAPKEYGNQETIIKGDSKEKVISLASVVAKVARDAYMTKQHKKYPLYGWDKNKGYGTREHRTAIRKEGIVVLHRKSFLNKIMHQ